MGLFDSFRKGRKPAGGRGSGSKPGSVRGSTEDDIAHLDEWAAQRRGVEGFIEPATRITDTTVVLIAHDGEWTRRRIGSLDTAQEFGHKRAIPVYEVSKVGYPQRMRDYTERQKILERRRRRGEA